MDRQTIDKANKIIKKIETMQEKINYLKKYIEKDITVYFKRNPDSIYAFPAYDPLILTAEDVLSLIKQRKKSIKKFEEELDKL